MSFSEGSCQSALRCPAGTINYVNDHRRGSGGEGGATLGTMNKIMIDCLVTH